MKPAQVCSAVEMRYSINLVYMGRSVQNIIRKVQVNIPFRTLNDYQTKPPFPETTTALSPLSSIYHIP